jgi:hypothetical protein
MKSKLFYAILLFMRQLLSALLISSTLLVAGCGSSSGTTVRVVKPRYHHWFYKPNHKRFYVKSDKRTKRTKLVKVKN